MHSKFNKMKFSYVNCKDNEEGNLENTSNSEDKEENLEVFNQNIPYDTSDMLTLEGLRRQYNSCSNCGVSWYDDHISLDCSECGGYAMCRPCPKCNGQCESIWRRDVKASHVHKKAEWHGTCTSNSQWNSSNVADSNLSEDSNANFQNAYLQCSHLASKPQTFIHEAHIL